MRGGFVASLGPVETVLGQEKGKQSGFVWILLLRWTATEQEGHGQQESVLSSILLALPHVGQGQTSP